MTFKSAVPVATSYCKPNYQKINLYIIYFFLYIYDCNWQLCYILRIAVKIMTSNFQIALLATSTDAKSIPNVASIINVALTIQNIRSALCKYFTTQIKVLKYFCMVLNNFAILCIFFYATVIMYGGSSTYDVDPFLRRGVTRISV